MIRLTFVVPYPALEKRAVQTFHSFSARHKIKASIFVQTAEQIDRTQFHCDVIVARGYSAGKLRQRYPDIPVIEIPITGYDIIQSIRECVANHRASRIAIIGVYNEFHDVELLSETFGCELRRYHASSIDAIEGVVRQAMRDGFGAVIGGYSVNRCAGRLGLSGVVIKTGDEAITYALSEAVRTVEVIQREREQAEVYRTIIQSSQDGILYVNRELRLQAVNRAALALAGGESRESEEGEADRLFPFLRAPLEKVLQTGEEITGDLQRHGGGMLSVQYRPVAVDGAVVGVVITLQDITRIQRLEAQVRKKLSSKGLYARYTFGDVTGSSEALRKTVHMAKRYAGVASNVLLLGETGTGKELIAQSIHSESPRREGPFVAINCASLQESLLESELFGYEEGAFTGAVKGGKTGLMELAHMGTLFLDEVSEIPQSLQGKLLRVLQEREVRRVGGTAVVSVDVRIIAATNRSLTEMVREGTFRQDLLYRLEVLRLKIPALRSRREDIPALLHLFLEEYNERYHYEIDGIEPDGLELLLQYPFHGNVRELRNVVERLCVLKGGGIIGREDVAQALYDDEAPEGDAAPAPFGERERLLRALRDSMGSRSDAAKLLGIDRTTLWRKMKKYGIPGNTSEAESSAAPKD